MTPNRTPNPSAKTFVVWWAEFDRLLRNDHLPEASLAVARPYFDLGLSPREAFTAEAAVQSRMIAA